MDDSSISDFFHTATIDPFPKMRNFMETLETNVLNASTGISRVQQSAGAVKGMYRYSMIVMMSVKPGMSRFLH